MLVKVNLIQYNITTVLESDVLDHQVAADVKEDFLFNFLKNLIIFKLQIHKDELSKLHFRW